MSTSDPTPSPDVLVPPPTNWLLIVQKRGCEYRLKSIPEQPTFYKNQLIYLTFSNQTNESLVIGIIALGLDNPDGDEEPGTREIVMGKEYQWIKGGIQSSGIVPIPPELSKTVKFRIPATLNNTEHDLSKPFFAYDAFIIGSTMGTVTDDMVSIESNGAGLIQLVRLEDERAIDPIVHIPPI